MEPTEPSPPPMATEPQPGETPNTETLIDLWQSDGATPSAAWPLPVAPVPEGPVAVLPDEGALLSLDELPEPPATFCDAEQEEEAAPGGGETQPQGLGCQHAPQEDTPGRETPPITNGEMAPKDGTPGRGEQVSITRGWGGGDQEGGGGVLTACNPPRPARATSASPRRRRCPPLRSRQPKPPSPSSTTSPQVSGDSKGWGVSVPSWGTPCHPDPPPLLPVPPQRLTSHAGMQTPCPRRRRALGGACKPGPHCRCRQPAPAGAGHEGAAVRGWAPPLPRWGPAG